ncbi:ATP-dependent helicase wrn-1-like [Saccostrea cucullata]|uniref:ATP-dependent helicase wrn-1-like n=1 Tax=Saccostrea cuccullata TaxID=36930 RepID=UPI002ED4EA63
MADLEKKICEKFNLNSLTENQKLAISSLRENRDIFIGTKTGSGKSLTYQCVPIVYGENSVTVIIAPLISIMKEQVESLSSLGYRAVYIEGSTDVERVASGYYNFVFGSPEVLVGETKWRDALKNPEFKKRHRLIVVDEAHTIIHWGEGKNQQEAAFREWFSHIGELRSLCLKVPCLALTATACPSHRRKIMSKLCFGKNACVISDTPDRKNIKISVTKIKQNDDLDVIFSSIIEGLDKEKDQFPRHLIFCNSIKDCSLIYMTFLKHFGKSHFFNMFHSKTTDCVKDKIRADMGNPNGQLRILICTNAAGMGVNYSDLYNVIHYGPPVEIDTFVQQMGRAGRDNNQSHDLIIYKSAQLKKIDNDMKDLVVSDKCRRLILTNSYMCDPAKDIKGHFCCDICERNCKCGEELCPYKHPIVRLQMPDTDSKSDDSDVTTTDEETD